MAGVAVTGVEAIDILGLGAVAVDDLLYVEAYPPADSKVRVLRRGRQCGGLTATALVAAARAGARCAYAGVVGTDELSAYALEQLEGAGIDTNHTVRDASARIIHSVVVVDTTRQTRNIFFDVDAVVGASAAWPPAELIHAARVLFVDHIGADGMLRAAWIARDARIPIVADFEDDRSPAFPALLDVVDHLILSHEFAEHLTGTSDPAAAALSLWNDRRQVVAITCGGDGAWFVDRVAPTRARHQPAFPVRVVDSTGCGDVFHGAYAAALLRSLPAAGCIRYAAAAAALKATQPGGQAGIPGYEQIEAFLAQGVR
jgi:sugar/nucleoside kinase (ribokinase family)